MDIDQLIRFLGWSTLLNALLLTIATLFLAYGRQTVIKIHSALFEIEANQLPAIYFNYLAHYKLAIIVFNLVPYLVLRFLL